MLGSSKEAKEEAKTISEAIILPKSPIAFFDPPVEPLSTDILYCCISIGQSYFREKKAEAFFTAIEKSGFKEVVIVVMDKPQRYTYQIDGVPKKRASSIATYNGDAWLKKHRKYIDRLSPGIKVTIYNREEFDSIQEKEDLKIASREVKDLFLRPKQTAELQFIINSIVEAKLEQNKAKHEKVLEKQKLVYEEKIWEKWLAEERARIQPLVIKYLKWGDAIVCHILNSLAAKLSGRRIFIPYPMYSGQRVKFKGEEYWLNQIVFNWVGKTFFNSKNINFLPVLFDIPKAEVQQLRSEIKYMQSRASGKSPPLLPRVSVEGEASVSSFPPVLGRTRSKDRPILAESAKVSPKREGDLSPPSLSRGKAPSGASGVSPLPIVGSSAVGSKGKILSPSTSSPDSLSIRRTPSRSHIKLEEDKRDMPKSEVAMAIEVIDGLAKISLAGGADASKVIAAAGKSLSEVLQSSGREPQSPTEDSKLLYSSRRRLSSHEMASDMLIAEDLARAPYHYSHVPLVLRRDTGISRGRGKTPSLSYPGAIAYRQSRELLAINARRAQVHRYARVPGGISGTVVSDSNNHQATPTHSTRRMGSRVGI